MVISGLIFLLSIEQAAFPLLFVTDLLSIGSLFIIDAQIPLNPTSNILIRLLRLPFILQQEPLDISNTETTLRQIR